MKITILSGSSRPDNNTMRLALAIANQLPEAQIIDFKDYDIPFPNQGWVDRNNLTAFQAQLLTAFEEAHLLFVLSPEYNWFPSAELINMVHQLANSSHIRIFNNKVFAFCGVSSGAGGRIPTIQLGNLFDKILNVFNMNSITSPKKFEARFIMDVLDKDGKSLGNSEFDAGLKQFIDHSVKLAKKWN